MPPLSELSVAERAALLRACHCEEKVLLGQIEQARDQRRQNFPGAESRLTVKESELQILRATIRKLWTT